MGDDLMMYRMSLMETVARNVKITLIGDEGVGKSAFLCRFMFKNF